MSARCVFVLRRRADVPVGHFIETWRGPHAQLVARHAKALGLIGYTQLHTVRGSRTNQILRAWRRLLPPYDGIDVWWLDRAVFDKAVRSRAGRAALAEIIASEREFIDHRKSAAWLAEAHLFRDDAEQRPASDGPVRKLVWVGRGLAPQTNREFQDHYLHHNGPLVAHNAQHLGIHRYLQVHNTRDPMSDELRELRGTGEPYPVSAELNWNITDVLKGGRQGALAAAVVGKDEEAHIDFARSAIWEADEHVVVAPPRLPLSEAARFPKPQGPAKPVTLEGKVAVVTGAASGIGRAVALELAGRGVDVALVTRQNQQGLDATAAQVRALGRRASTHLVDATDREQMARLPQAVVDALGAVHILVNNAGVTVFGEFEQQSLDSIDWIVRTNLGGVLNGCKLFLPYLKREGYGHICNVSSLQGLLALTSQSTYAATKFAVRGFSEALRGELEPHGIGVSCVFPGIIKTDIVRTGRSEGEAAAQLRSDLNRFVQRRAMPPERCARQIVDGIEANAPRVLITPESHVADALKRLFPIAIDKAAAGLMRMGIPG